MTMAKLSIGVRCSECEAISAELVSKVSLVRLGADWWAVHHCRSCRLVSTRRVTPSAGALDRMRVVTLDQMGTP